MRACVSVCVCAARACSHPNQPYIRTNERTYVRTHVQNTYILYAHMYRCSILLQRNVHAFALLYLVVCINEIKFVQDSTDIFICGKRDALFRSLSPSFSRSFTFAFAFYITNTPENYSSCEDSSYGGEQIILL